jgi:hypothetical protein
MTKEQLVIKSNSVQIIGSDGPIMLNTNKDIHLSSVKQVTFDVGVQGSPTSENVFRVNSPKIELGLQPNFVVTQQAIPKSDILIDKLNKMLEIMSDMIEQPNEKDYNKGKIIQLQKELHEIKSTISFTS